MTEYIQVVTTTATEQQAQQLASVLVEQRLAGCVQLAGPIHSVYRWQEKVEQAVEWLCLVKTKRTLFAAVEQSIRQHHSYDCPEIIAVPIVAGNAAYLDWLDNQLSDDVS